MAYDYGGYGGWYPQTSVWGSLGQGLAGVADAFWQVQRFKQAQDQKALENVQTLFKLYPEANPEQKQQWISSYQQQVGKNKFWDKGAFQFPTQTQTQGQPNFMGPAAPSTPTPGVASPFADVTPPAPGATPPPAPGGIDPFSATRKPEEAVPPVPPGTQAAPYTPGTPETKFLVPGVSGANRPLSETYPAGTPTGDALRRVVPANLLGVPRDQLPPEVQTQVDEITKRITTSALRTPVNLADFIPGYRLRGGAETEPTARAFIKGLEGSGE